MILILNQVLQQMKVGGTYDNNIVVSGDVVDLSSPNTYIITYKRERKW